MAPARRAAAMAVKLEVEEFGADECGCQGSSADGPDAPPQPQQVDVYPGLWFLQKFCVLDWRRAG